MFGLGAPELLLLMFSTAGILMPTIVCLLHRLTAGETLLAVVLAVLIPGIGPMASILITITRCRGRSHMSARTITQAHPRPARSQGPRVASRYEPGEPIHPIA